MGPGRKIFIVRYGMKTPEAVVEGLRPQESDLQPIFCWFTWADEYEHMSEIDRCLSCILLL